MAGNRRYGNGGASFSHGEAYANRSLEAHKRLGPYPELNENAKSEGLWGYGLTQEQKNTMSPEELEERRRAEGEDLLEAVLSKRAARVQLATTKPTRANKNEAARLNAAAAAREAALRAARATVPPSVSDWKRKTRNNRNSRKTRKHRSRRNSSWGV